MKKQITENVKGGCCCASDTRNQVEEIVAATQSTDLPRHTLMVKGASCGGCVDIIDRALLSVAGVEAASMDLSTGIAIISGDVTTETLINALESVDFSATKAE